MGSISYGAVAPAPIPPWQSKVDSWVLETADTGETEFLVFLSEQADLGEAARLPNKPRRANTSIRPHRHGGAHAGAPAPGAQTSRPGVSAVLGREHDLGARGHADVQALAQRGDVAHIYANPAVHVDEPNAEPASRRPQARPARRRRVEHRQGQRAGGLGRGLHRPGRRNRRAGHRLPVGSSGTERQVPRLGGPAANHNYNWHDAIHTTTHSSSCGANSPAPCDDYGHGTHTMGTMVGDDRAGNQIGMAPGARWIGCRNMDTAGARRPPTPNATSGSSRRPRSRQPRPDKAPDVINNSWAACPAKAAPTRRPADRGPEGPRRRHRHGAVGGKQRLGLQHRARPGRDLAESFTVGATNQRQQTASPISAAAAR